MLLSNRSTPHVTTSTALPCNLALRHFVLMTSSHKRSWIGLLVLCAVSSVSVSRFDRCRFGNPTSYSCRCDRHTSSAMNSSSPFSTMFVVIALVTTVDPPIFSLSRLIIAPTPVLGAIANLMTLANSFVTIIVFMTSYCVSRPLHLPVTELPWLSLTRSLDVGRNALRLPSSSRLTHSFSLTLILSHLSMSLHLSLYSRRRIFTRFLISTLVFFIILVVFILELSFPYFSACMFFTDCSRIFKVMYDHG